MKGLLEEYGAAIIIAIIGLAAVGAFEFILEFISSLA